MGFLEKLGNVFKDFKGALAAGKDFNPVFKDVVNQIDELRAAGKLDASLAAAEAAYNREHDAYAAKGAHTNAEDSKQDVAALTHFIAALKDDDTLPKDLQDKADKLFDMQTQMQAIMSKIGAE